MSPVEIPHCNGLLPAPATMAVIRCMAGSGSRKASNASRDEPRSRSHQKNGRRPARNCRPQMVPVVAYFRLATAVRSNLPVTTNVALHQLEPNPPGLIGVKSPVNRAVWSLVNALQSPLFRSLS